MARQWGFIIGLCGALLAAAVPTAAQITSEPAALLIFPRVLLDTGTGVDTVVQLANTSDQAVEVRCVYEDDAPTCNGTGSCFPDASSCQGVCELQWSVFTSRLRLTPNQPLGWSVARGLSDPPLDGVDLLGPVGSSNAGTAVPAVSSPFDGSMRCFAVDDRGRPIERNVLIGTASIETDADAEPPGSGGPAIDAARYDAIGLQAIEGSNDSDEVLRLGGLQPEYTACPTTLVLPHVFDGAQTQTGAITSRVWTTLALVPCSGDLLSDSPPTGLVQLLVRNEFGQRFSTSRSFQGSLALPISLFDTTDQSRSILSVGVGGTLTGQTSIEDVGDGVVGVAFETRQPLVFPGAAIAGGAAAPQYRAAYPLGAEGVRVDPAVLAELRPPCHGDCNGDGQVFMNELILGVTIGLGSAPVGVCFAADGDENGAVRIDEVLRAVLIAQTACPARKVPTVPVEPQPTPRPTPTPPTAVGPDITFLGIASADDVAQAPVETDAEGRDVFEWPAGQGFSLIVEARPGFERGQVGRQATAPGGATLPDLQVILSNAIGDGSTALCDTEPPTAGGVPATEPFEFSDAPEVIRAINDLGCRADDGRGLTQGRQVPAEACTRMRPSGEIAAAGQGSTVQFCIPIARAWALPEGETRVAARVRSVSGEVGPAREIVVRVLP